MKPAKDNFEDESVRPITLWTFHHQGDRFTLYRVPKAFRKHSQVRAAYTVPLLKTERAEILMRNSEAPEVLPAGFARYGEYEVYIPEAAQVASFVTRFQSMINFEETEARLRLWVRGSELVNKLWDMLEKEEAARNDKRRSS